MYLYDNYLLLSNLGPAMRVECYDEWHSTKKFKACVQGQEISFDGDEVRKYNAAWPWACKYKSEVRYNQPSNRSLRKWAYVMWDIDRLERWKVLNMKVREIKDNQYHLGANMGRRPSAAPPIGLPSGYNLAVLLAMLLRQLIGQLYQYIREIFCKENA